MRHLNRPILLDAHAIGSELGGNERYIRGLIEGFASIGRRDVFSLALDERIHGSGKLLLEGWETLSLGCAPSRFNRLMIRFPQLMAEGKHQLLHVTAVSPPLLSGRTIVTIHDILFEDHPTYFPWQQTLAFKVAFRQSARNATRIITISKYTEQRLIELYRVPPEKISVTPLGVGPEFRPTPPESVSLVRQKFGIQGKYLLAVGNLHPRKNLYRLGVAFRDLVQKGKLEEVSLVLVGKKTWRAEKVLAPLLPLMDLGRVVLTGYVEDGDLPSLYSGAQAFVYPSLFEGFGIPPLEAMACGTPVIAGYSSSLPEVCGDSACWIDPWSLDDLKAALIRIVDDENYRIQKTRTGLVHAESYSWKRTAESTMTAYETALNSGA